MDIPGLTPSYPSPVRAQLKSSGYWEGGQVSKGKSALVSILEVWPEIFQIGGCAGWVLPLQALEKKNPTQRPPEPSHILTLTPLGHTCFLHVGQVLKEALQAHLSFQGCLVPSWPPGLLRAVIGLNPHRRDAGRPGTELS